MAGKCGTAGFETMRQRYRYASRGRVRASERASVNDVSGNSDGPARRAGHVVLSAARESEKKLAGQELESWLR